MPFQKGHKINLGKKYSKERIEKTLAWRKDIEKFNNAKIKIGLAHKGMKHTEVAKLKMSLAKKGKHISPATEFKKNDKRIIGNKNYNWKGDDVKYRSLHSWVDRLLGKPERCEKCDKFGLKGHQIHWANISGEYKREKLDWIRLCVKCHSRYDHIR